MKVSLEQWNALVNVVESGGYAQAGARLHKSQSTLTYAIQKLEDVLGVQAFEIKGRKAVLTAAGQVLYRRGKALLDEAMRLEHAAGELAQGWEPEIRIAVEIVFPTWLLLECMAEFGRERPDTRIELFETVIGGNEEMLAQRKVDLAVGPFVPAGFVGDPLMDARFICLAAPSHPLHALGRKLTTDDLRAHRHLILRDTGARTRSGGGWQNERRWTVSNKATWIRAAVMGLGFAWYPEDAVREEIDAGALKPLPLREGGERAANLFLMYADRDAAGPGTRRLADILRERVAVECRRRQE